MSQTPRLALPLIQGGQAQKHLTLNAALMRLESLVQAQVISRLVAAEPAGVQDGDSYVLPAGASGPAWSDLPEGSLVRAESGLWERVDFPVGGIVHVVDSHSFIVRTADGWTSFEDAIQALRNLSALGVNAVADDYNVLAVRGPAALVSADYAGSGGSGDVSLVVNKEADGGTAQILLQTDYSTRAVIGLLETNDLTVKVSGDGASFITALIVKPSGAVHVPAGPVIDAGGRTVLRSYVVADLPVTGVAAGTLVYASNGRMFSGAGVLEGPGAGTGGVVCWNGSLWTIIGTHQAVSA